MKFIFLYSEMVTALYKKPQTISCKKVDLEVIPFI